MLTAVVGLLQLIAIGFQVGIAKTQSRISDRQRAIMDTQSGHMAGQLQAAVDAATAAKDNASAATDNAVAATTAATVAADALTATRIIERAYVSLSHGQPGLTFYNEENPGAFDVRVAIGALNSGHTPADVLAFEIKLVGGKDLPPNPARPPVPEIAGPLFTLMPNETVYVWSNFPASSAEDLERIKAMEKPVAVVGWILYRDRFGKRHRSGYARRYLLAPSGDMNNLVFTNAAGYNYEEDLD